MRKFAWFLVILWVFGGIGIVWAELPKEVNDWVSMINEKYSGTTITVPFVLTLQLMQCKQWLTNSLLLLVYE